jgi:predicted phosphodiesterase
MYRFQLISDIHLEFNPKIKISKIADYLILAGDIGYPEQETFKNFFSNVSKLYKKVFYVSGNHEYYQNWKKGKNEKTIDEINIKIKEVIGECGENIYFLNNDCHVLDSKLRIIGTTLWSNIKNKNLTTNDNYQIYSGRNTLVTNEYLTNKHFQNVEFIKSEIEKANNSDKKLVVISHHIPSLELILEKYKIKYPSYISHFASDLDKIINDPIKVWCSGHSHGFNKKKINGVDCYVNAYGYVYEERNGSNLDFTFEFDI